MANEKKQETPPTNAYRTKPTNNGRVRTFPCRGTLSITNEILNGTLDLEGFDLSKEMKLFLQSLQQTPKEREMHIPGRMPRKAFQEVMKIQNENTSSSPSALHYTLWKAIAEVDELAACHLCMGSYVTGTNER
eukprot:scaffold3976_cov45-Cyclotella_meneghiniana.AAC.11